MTESYQANRNTIFVEDARVISVAEFPGEQFVIRLKSPRCASRATAGSFIHIQCDTAIPMRRPLSIMRVNASEGWVDILFKAIGEGLHALARKQSGDDTSVIGPIGRGFMPDRRRPRALLIGGGVGIPPMIFLAEELKNDNHWQPLVIMGSEIPFPFETKPSTIETPWLASQINSTMPLVESWGMPTRLATLQGFEGCYAGFVTDLSRAWLQTLSKDELAEVSVYSCGPTPMLAAVADLANEFGLPCQVSLEEFMACAVGGCAGCAVPVETDQGPAMKRVCVDGPVFDASSVFTR